MKPELPDFPAEVAGVRLAEIFGALGEQADQEVDPAEVTVGQTGQLGPDFGLDLHLVQLGHASDAICIHCYSQGAVTVRCRRPCRRRGCSSVAVEVVAGPVVAHGGAGVGVTGSNLDVAQISASVETGRDVGVTEHMRICPGDPDGDGFGEPVQAAGGRVPVHPGTAGIQQDRPADPGGHRPVDGPADRGRQRDQHHLGALTAHAQDPVPVLLAEVGDVRTGGLENSQAKQSEHGHEREVVRVR